MHRVRALLVPAAAGVLLVATAVPAAAGDTLTIDPVPASPFDREVARFDLEVNVVRDEACETSLGFEVEDEEGNPITDFTVEQGVLQFGPSVPGGEYTVTVTCTNGQEQTLSASGEVLFARGVVVKAVEGDAPADAAFVVEVACEGEGEEVVEDVSVAGAADGAPFTLEFEYGPAGGEELFVVYGPQVCEVTETDDGGADDVAVSGDFTFPEPADETVTVTNTFEGEPREEPPAALPEQVAPDFTG